MQVYHIKTMPVSRQCYDLRTCVVFKTFRSDANSERLDFYGKIKTHLVFPTALHIFNHSMEQEEKQLMVNYIKGTRNKETVDVAGLSKHTKNNLHKIPEFAKLRNTINDATHEVVKKMEFKYDSLEMTGMWGNALPKRKCTRTTHTF